MVVPPAGQRRRDTRSAAPCLGRTALATDRRDGRDDRDRTRLRPRHRLAHTRGTRASRRAAWAGCARRQHMRVRCAAPSPLLPRLPHPHELATRRHHRYRCHHPDRTRAGGALGRAARTALRGPLPHAIRSLDLSLAQRRRGHRLRRVRSPRGAACQASRSLWAVLGDRLPHGRGGLAASTWPARIASASAR